MTCLMGGEEADRAADKLKAYGILNYFDPARAVPSLEALADYRDVTEREYEQPVEFDFEKDRAQEVLSEVVERGVDHLSVEAMNLLDAYGVPIPDDGLAESAAEAEAIARDLGGSVVMKIASPDILHKSDIGGVEVGVAIENVRDTFQDFLDRAAEHNPDATILGVQVEELVYYVYHLVTERP